MQRAGPKLKTEPQAMDISEMIARRGAVNTQVKETATKPKKVDNEHVSKKQKATEGVSKASKKRKVEKGSAGDKLKGKEKELPKSADVAANPVGVSQGSKSEEPIVTPRRRLACWLAPGYILPIDDEEGGKALSEEISRVARLRHMGTPGCYPPKAGAAKLARVADFGLVEEMEENKVKADDLISHLGDSLSEVSSYALSLKNYLEDQVKGKEACLQELHAALTTRDAQVAELGTNEEKLKEDLTLARQEADQEKAEVARLKAEVEGLKVKVGAVEEEKKSLEAKVIELGKRPAAEDVDPEVDGEESERALNEKIKDYQRGQLFTLRALGRHFTFKVSPEKLASMLHRASNVDMRGDHETIPFDEEEVEFIKGKVPDWEVPTPMKGNVVEHLCFLRGISYPYDGSEDVEEDEEDKGEETQAVDNTDVVKESQQED